MVKIVLYGDRSDTSLTLPLCRCLERQGGVLYYGGGHLAEYCCAAPNFTVFETDTISGCDGDNTVVIFKSAFNQPPDIWGREGILAVCENENRRAVDFLSSRNVNMLTCSAGGRGALTISSIGDSGAVINLSRCLTTFTGRYVMPGEVTIKTAPIPNAYALLAVCSVLLVSDKINE
ncbi:MAG: hypothetical protein K5756_10240 [Clostridiales bacterium]|nr:hypothetical protein [Clostridiales bacterium]